MLWADEESRPAEVSGSERIVAKVTKEGLLQQRRPEVSLCASRSVAHSLIMSIAASTFIWTRSPLKELEAVSR